MSVLQKKNERAQQVNIPACISCYLGVTEPALFGVNLKNGFPLVCGMIGSSVAAVIATSFQVEAYSIGVGGLPGILSIKPQYWLGFLIAMAAAIVIPFGLTIAVAAAAFPLLTGALPPRLPCLKPPPQPNRKPLLSRICWWLPSPVR